MTEYIVKQDKNGKNRYYRVEGGKKTAIKQPLSRLTLLLKPKRRTKQ